MRNAVTAIRIDHAPPDDLRRVPFLAAPRPTRAIAESATTGKRVGVGVETTTRSSSTGSSTGVGSSSGVVGRAAAFDGVASATFVGATTGSVGMAAGSSTSGPGVAEAIGCSGGGSCVSSGSSSGSGSGTSSKTLHLGQRPFFPAASSLTRIVASQAGQSNSMAMVDRFGAISVTLTQAMQDRLS